MILNGYKFEFSSKFALLNFKHIRQFDFYHKCALLNLRCIC